MARRQVEWDGQTYKVRSDKVAIPDLTKIDRMAALVWINRETVERGRSTRRPNPLAGLAGAITLGVRGT